MPVVSLEYETAGDAGRSLARVARGAAGFVLFRSALDVTQYGLNVACYAWHMASVGPYRQRIDGLPLVVDAVPTVLAGVTVLGAVGAVRLRQVGRRVVVVAAAIGLALEPVADLIDGLYYQGARRYYVAGPAYVTYTASHTVEAALYTAAVWLAILLFFRSPAVRQAYARP